jgi:hypothetical protein
MVRRIRSIDVSMAGSNGINIDIGEASFGCVGHCVRSIHRCNGRIEWGVRVAQFCMPRIRQQTRPGYAEICAEVAINANFEVVSVDDISERLSE